MINETASGISIFFMSNYYGVYQYLRIGFIPYKMRLIRWSFIRQLHAFIHTVLLAPCHHLFHDAQMVVVLIVSVAVCHSLRTGQLEAGESIQEPLCEEVTCPAVEKPSLGDFIAALIV